jgi:competence protein ComEA
LNEEGISLPEPGGTESNDKTIDLNKATKEELMTVPGIGPSTADNIINYRDEAGRFNSVDDLLNVDRIGDKTLEKIQKYFIVR